MRIAVDIGGTFTDLVAVDDDGQLYYAKSLTTYDDLSRGVFNCVAESGVELTRVRSFLHGSTIAINTVIQENGARTALVTTRGFRDAYEIGRSNRPDAYNLLFRRPRPLVPRDLRFEVDERLDARGGVVRSLDENQVREIGERLGREGVDSIAVVFLHAYANPAHEQRVGEILERICPDVPVSLSHQILREFREYERTSTTVLNAYVAPVVAGYLRRIEEALEGAGFTGSFLVMQSNGGAMSVAQARQKPVATMESGPVAGVIGAGKLGTSLNAPNIIAFDMGGTTAKASLLMDGEAQVITGYHIGGDLVGHPMMLPVVDIVEVGAGGGSIAWLDPAGALKVGPNSAGADPGPVCYGLGGTEPTVTDANLVLGRLRPDGFLGGRMKLDPAAAARAIEEKIARPLGMSVEAAAQGILEIVNTRMSLAVREVSVARGYDARTFSLVASGGAGPIHVLSIARQLSIPKVIVPPYPGTFSAFGMLQANLRHDYVQTFVGSLGTADITLLNAAFSRLEDEGRQTLQSETSANIGIAMNRAMDLRYQGQEYTLTVPVEQGRMDEGALEHIATAFHGAHEKRYAQSAPGEPVEIVNLRVTAVGETDTATVRVSYPPGAPDGEPDRRQVWFGNGFVECPVIPREMLSEGMRVEGPALIEEYVSTTVLHPGDVAVVAEGGSLVIEVVL